MTFAALSVGGGGVDREERRNEEKGKCNVNMARSVSCRVLNWSWML